MTPSAPAVAGGRPIALDALVELVATVAEDFPAPGLQAGPADAQEALDELLPTADAAVLVVPTASGPARDLFVVVAPPLLTTMGVSSMEDLPAAVERVLAELADGDAVDSAAVRLGTGAEAISGLPVRGSAPGAVMVAAGVFAGADHLATVGVAVHPAGDDEPAATEMELPTVSPVAAAGNAPTRAAGGRGLDLLGMVEMNVVAELGRARMTVAELLSLGPGSVVELDRAAGSPIDLLVNGTLIARGEVVVVDEEFGLRISEIVEGHESR